MKNKWPQNFTHLTKILSMKIQKTGKLTICKTTVLRIDKYKYTDIIWMMVNQNQQN